jgi:hypothetical protein
VPLFDRNGFNSLDSILADDGANALSNEVELGWLQPSHGPLHAGFVGCDHPVGQGKAGPRQSAACFKIGRQKRHGFWMPGCLAGDLAKNQIASGQRRHH